MKRFSIIKGFREYCRYKRITTFAIAALALFICSESVVYGKVTLWDVATHRKLATLEGLTGWVRSVAFSPDGTILASGGGDGKVTLWDVETGRNIATFFKHQDPVQSVAFSPTDRTLASADERGSILLWDVSRYDRSALATPDFNGDGRIDFSDFLLFAGQFGQSHGDAGYDARFDLDGDGAVGFSDFVIFAGSFGRESTGSGLRNPSKRIPGER
ncbi:MAG: hypothetical protein OXR72_13865 [Gemmatimonadota bacterium]|nr:hypothetical protein [Gemmatimonadota bacterium]